MDSWEALILAMLIDALEMQGWLGWLGPDCSRMASGGIDHLCVLCGLPWSNKLSCTRSQSSWAGFLEAHSWGGEEISLLD